nr:hypothetical protein [uncultured Desulfobulbus sp.]
MLIHQQLQCWYSGTPKEKLGHAFALHTLLQDNPPIEGVLEEALASLQHSCEQLSQQMTHMHMGALCSACASQANGGCCSAYMADNTDSIQILINLLLGRNIVLREPTDSECCFLGPQGCLFMAKPIFCLNYNCTHIVHRAAPLDLHQLEQRAAKVLGQQTTIETWILDHLRPLFLEMP